MGKSLVLLCVNRKINRKFFAGNIFLGSFMVD